MSGVSSLSARHPDRLRRRTALRARDGRGRATRRRRGQGWQAVRRPVRATARPRVRCGGHRPRGRLRHECGQTLQVGQGRPEQTSPSPDAKRRRSARMLPVARGRDRARQAAGDCLSRSDCCKGALRADFQRHEKTRHRHRVRVGVSCVRNGTPLGRAARAERSASSGRADVYCRYAQGRAVLGQALGFIRADTPTNP